MLITQRGLLADRVAAGYAAGMTATLAIDLPTGLTLQGKSRAELEQRSKFLLALKYFELGEITSGQAAQMATDPTVRGSRVRRRDASETAPRPRLYWASETA